MEAGWNASEVEQRETRGNRKSIWKIFRRRARKGKVRRAGYLKKKNGSEAERLRGRPSRSSSVQATQGLEEEKDAHK